MQRAKQLYSAANEFATIRRHHRKVAAPPGNFVDRRSLSEAPFGNGNHNGTLLEGRRDGLFLLWRDKLA